MKIGVLGCGNMAAAVVLGIHRKYSELEFHCYTPSFTRAEVLSENLQDRGFSYKNLSDIPDMDYWFVACKPQQVESLAKNLKHKLTDANIVSFLAGTTIDTLQSLFCSKSVLRIMPNTPIKIGEGISLLTAASECGAEFKSSVEEHLASCGRVISLKTEKELDQLTLFSGCGPAYIFYFAKTLEEKMEAMGFSSDISRPLINQLFVGSSRLMANETAPLSDLVDQVTSKGGVTIEAINEYKRSGLDVISSTAIDKAQVRSDEIASLIR